MRFYNELKAQQLRRGAIKWEGEGLNGIGCCSTGDFVARIYPSYFSPAEGDTLLGDPTKTRVNFDWTPSTTLKESVAEIMTHDKEDVRREVVLGFKTFHPVRSSE